MPYDYMSSYKGINLGAVHTAILSSILGERLSRRRRKSRGRRIRSDWGYPGHNLF